MPIPTPRANESKSEFIARCMNDDVMKREYPDQAQRSAICNGAWDEKHNMVAAYLKLCGYKSCEIVRIIRRIGG